MEPRKVKYVAGSGCMLHQELSDGQYSFQAGIEYEIPNYADFLRLVSTGDFVEVPPKKVAPRVASIRGLDAVNEGDNK